MKWNALKNKDPFSAQQYEKITLQKVQLCFQFLEMGPGLSKELKEGIYHSIYFNSLSFLKKSN